MEYRFRVHEDVQALTITYRVYIYNCTFIYDDTKQNSNTIIYQNTFMGTDNHVDLSKKATVTCVLADNKIKI